jgi:hypothetical protein
MALIFWPGVRMTGEISAGDMERAERAERGVEGVDIVCRRGINHAK